MLNIHNWNVNSVNARLEHLLFWLETQSPDIMCLQEIKCINEKFPREQIESLGYNVITNGQKTYNGVAILSKLPIDEIIYDFPNNPIPDQKRYLEIVTTINKQVFRVISVYVPNGQALDSDKFSYKMNFYDALFEHSQTLLTYDENIIICGDYNVAPQEIDVYDANLLKDEIGFSLAERQKLNLLLYNSYSDSFRLKNPNKQQFSWWDYRKGAWQQNKGLRIDHILLSPQACDRLESTSVDMVLGDKIKPSDHAITTSILRV